MAKRIVIGIAVAVAVIVGIFTMTGKSSNVSEADYGTYKCPILCMKDKMEELSMAGTYVESEATVVKDKDGNHMTTKFLRSDWMKDIKIEIDGKEVKHEEEKLEGNEFLVKFDVPSEESEIRVSLHVVPMQADVAFRIVPECSGEKVSESTDS